MQSTVGRHEIFVEQKIKNTKIQKKYIFLCLSRSDMSTKKLTIDPFT